MRPDSIPKTTSGKLRRTQCKHQWTVGSLRSSAISGQRRPTRETLLRVGPGGAPEYVLRLLQTEVAEVLHLTDPNDVPVDRPLLDVGLDSLGLIDLAQRVEDRTGARIPPASFGNDLTLQAMAISVVRHFESVPPEPDETPDTGDVPFSAGQRRALELGQWDGWTRTVMLDVHRRLTPDRLRRAASALIARHEALRLRFRRNGGRFTQRYGDIEGSFAVESVTLDRPDALPPLLSEQYRRVSVEHGPLLRLLLIGTGSRQRLFIAVSNLVMDGITLRILLDDLDQLCRLDEQGEDLRLARTSARFEVFSGWMNDFARGDAKADLEFWRTQLAVPPPATYDPLAHPGVQMEDLGTARHSLPPEETRALRNVRMTGPDAGRAPLATTLLTALVRTAQRQWSCGRLVVELSGSGRQTAVHGLDLSRTVGALHCTFPLAFEDSRSQGPAETLAAVGGRLAGVPSAGLSFDSLKYLHDDPDLRQSIRQAPAPTLWFDFQGERPTRSRSGLFSLSAAAVGDVGDPGAGVRQPPLYVECAVVGGTTRIVWEYSPRRLWWTGGEIDQWMTRFRNELHHLVRSGTGVPVRQTSR
jgi:acyl carrier protein